MKTREAFPLWLHPSGQWAKKHRGRFHYFGTDRDAALKRYVAEWSDIVAGRPRSGRSRTEQAADLTLGQLADQFLALKRHRVDAGEMTEAVWAQYFRTAERIVRVLGARRIVATLEPPDFGQVRADAAKAFGPNTLVTFLTLARGLFRYGGELTDRPVRYGGQFAAPPRRVLRLHRQQQGPKLIAAGDLRRLIAEAPPDLKAQILLGLNCGFGAKDCSDLTHANLRPPGWVTLPRQKTGLPRRCPLWPETAKALAVAAGRRPPPRDPADSGRIFLSARGYPCVRFNPMDPKAQARGGYQDTILRSWKRLCEQLEVESPGGFYVLRHVFRTVADEVRDRPAIDLIMGHADPSQAAAYREQLDDQRLKAVTDHVRTWLRRRAVRGS